MLNITKPTLLILGLASAPLALADHNSPWGEGWANMPNDIHNTRIETLDSDDPSDFIDFVRGGNGAASVNDATQVARGSGMGGANGGGGGRAR